MGVFIACLFLLWINNCLDLPDFLLLLLVLDLLSICVSLFFYFIFYFFFPLFSSGLVSEQKNQMAEEARSGNGLG